MSVYCIRAWLEVETFQDLFKSNLNSVGFSLLPVMDF